jgi:hypothetical protein
MRQRAPKSVPTIGVATRGILRPLAGLERFELSRAAPPDDLAAFVVLFWTVRWNLPEAPLSAFEVPAVQPAAVATAPAAE